MLVLYSTSLAIAILAFILSDAQPMELRLAVAGGLFLFLSILATLWFVVTADELPPGINGSNEPPKAKRSNRDART